MTTERIINGIIAKRDELNYAENKENHEILDKILKLEEQIHNLAPRLEDMFKVVEALSDNGFWLGGKNRYNQAAPEFLTDHIDHRVGFFVRHPYFEAPGRDYTLKGYFGIANGGACGDTDLEIDRHGNVKRWDFSSRCVSEYDKKMRDRYVKDLERVIDKFDTFEASFYEYAKNPIPRSKRL